MIKQLVALFALVALAEAGGMADVSLTLVHEFAMVSTQPDHHYGLFDLSLIEKSWKTVSVNGPEATIYSPACQLLVKPVSNFTKSELDLLNQAKRSAEIVPPGETITTVVAESGTWKIGSVNAYLRPGTDPRKAHVRRGDSVLAQKIDVDNFTVQKTDLANNLDGIYVNGELVSFVYKDDKVLMKPVACLQLDELDLLERLSLEVPE